MSDDDRIAALEAAVDKLTGRVDTAIQDLERYKGFWGGIMLIISAMWAAFITWIEFFKG